MISFSQPVLTLSRQIQEYTSLRGIIPITPPNQERIFASTSDLLILMASSDVLTPSTSDPIFFDTPRATGRSQVKQYRKQ